MYYCNFARNEHVRYCTFTVISCLAFHTITFKRSLLRYILHFYIRWSRDILYNKNVKIYVNDQLSFLRGGPIQSIFVCVMKIVILENISKFLNLKSSHKRSLVKLTLKETIKMGCQKTDIKRRRVSEQQKRIPEVMCW